MATLVQGQQGATTTQQAPPAQQAPASSNVPVAKECSVPGKQAWVLWRTTFEIDAQYQPIKVGGVKSLERER